MIDRRGTSQNQDAARRIAERTTTTHTPTPCIECGCPSLMPATEYCAQCGIEQREPSVDPRDATIAELVAALERRSKAERMAVEDAMRDRDAALSALSALAFIVEHPLAFGNAEELTHRLDRARAALARVASHGEAVAKVAP